MKTFPGEMRAVENSSASELSLLGSLARGMGILLISSLQISLSLTVKCNIVKNVDSSQIISFKRSKTKA